MFIYSDNEPRKSGVAIPIASMNATKIYLDHYANYLYLDFIYKKSDKRDERTQAMKELGICERKMKFWKNHPNYAKETVENGIAKLKKDWNQK